MALKNQFFDEIKKQLIFLVLNSTSHGFPKIFSSSNKIIKYIWIFFSILSTCICAFLIIQNIKKYYDFEVTTKIRLKPQFKAIFPSITICNVNFFTSKESIELVQDLTNVTNYPNDPELFLFESGTNLLKSKTQNGKNYSDSISKLILKCFHLLIPCNLSEFDFYFSPTYGNCYTFNPGFDSNKNLRSFDQLISTSKTFKIQGLRLILNVSVPEELKFIMPSNGAAIYIHNQTDPAAFMRPIMAAPGVSTNIGLTKTRTVQNPKPYSQCDPDTQDPSKYNSELFKMVHDYYKSYKRVICFDYCYQRLSLKECGCNQPIFPSNLKKIPCLNKTKCISKQAELFSDGNYVSDFCVPECPLECEMISFTKTISVNKYSNDAFDMMMSKKLNLSNRKISEDIAQVNVYYESLDHTEIVEFATMDFVDLLSSIGGIAGLFLGISVLSLVEILEIVLEILFLYKNSIKSNSPISKVEL
ncbi:unnamed protein product [Brachionus calyciflorus]|uniref:Uncharacterized protein n=1 Tax=Brachionus calyciflorus TaxID=104777 RepID=A0A814IW44_9BILA|nr:unnamed protein product [Brachionus calyciflorus]